MLRDQAWIDLEQHYEASKGTALRDSLSELFAADSKRFDKLQVTAGGWLLDYSKNHLNEQTLKHLFQIAEASQLRQAMTAMASGIPVNNTEQRAVGHMALRSPAMQSALPDFVVANGNPATDIQSVRQRCADFARAIRSGEWCGYTGQKMKSIINIGIGGSDLGPQMATIALREFVDPTLKIFFVSNVDGQDLSEVLAQVDAQTTLFVIASKTFTTQETMANAAAARAWFLERSASPDAIAQHFVAVSTNTEAVRNFGIDPKNMFEFWDWVGGRYSLWSAIGLSLMIGIGPENFEAFLGGAHEVDHHFLSQPWQTNMPVLLALIEVWYRNCWGVSSRCIAPYHHRLRRLPAYLQQLDMESLGKSVDRDGNPLPRSSGLVVWGEPGTNGQHAYFQLLHQGTDLIPVDFILLAQADSPLDQQHQLLLANGLAQSRALMVGRSLADSGSTHKTFEGNRPSNTLIAPRLTPETLGALLAIYEHKVFTLSVLWGLNAFDQWGVELGKVLAKGTEALLGVGLSPDQLGQFDSSTLGLANQLKQWR